MMIKEAMVTWRLLERGDSFREVETDESKITSYLWVEFLCQIELMYFVNTSLTSLAVCVRIRVSR
jgi:hypothetical protein